MADLNVSGDFDEMQRLPLPPSLEQVESMVCASSTIALITKKASLKLYRKYLESRVPNFLTEWYLANYRGLTEMNHVRHDMGDCLQNSPETICGLEEDREPVANRIDTWARSTVPVQPPDPEYLTEKETEEKRRLRAQKFIEDKNAKTDAFRPMSGRMASAASTGRFTGTYSTPDTFRPQTVPQPDRNTKKVYRLEKPPSEKDPEEKKLDNDLRTRKAYEIKEAREMDKRKRAEKEQTEKEEKKRQKYQYEIKNKPYTYDIQGKITFLSKDAQKLPDVPQPKTQWVTAEDNKITPYYEHFAPLKDASLIANECDKKYKEFRTGDIPESMTLTIAESGKVIKPACGVKLVEGGKEVEGPPQAYEKMSQKEYKQLLIERDEKEQKDAERLRKEKELFEKRRAKQIERAAALAKLQKELGSVKIDMRGSMEEVYQPNYDAMNKITTTYRPSKLPTRNIKTADPREKKRREEEEQKRRIAAGKVRTYDKSKKKEKPESPVDEFNQNILEDSGDGHKANKEKNELRPQTAKERPKSGIESSKEKSKRIVKGQQVTKTKDQKKYLAPPPLGQTMGHGLMKPRKASPHSKDPII